MRNIAGIIGISIVLLVIGCKKSPELLSSDIPIFSGNVETSVSLKKVAFSASFKNLNPDNAEACGFEWSKQSGGQINVVSVGKISEYNFSAQLAVKLEEVATYRVRAWIVVGSKKFYSPYSYFWGIVALRPEIISLNRAYALWGDTIRIKIRNLTPDVLPGDVKIVIESEEIQPIFVDSTEIAVIMPFSYTFGKLSINIFVNNHPCTNTASIENALPETTSVSPEWIHFDDQISIKGKFRSEYSNRIELVERSGSAMYTYDPLSFTENEIILKISDNLACSPEIEILFKIYETQGGLDFHFLNTGNRTKRFDHWKWLNVGGEYDRPKAVSINSEVYILEKSASWPPSSFWKYNVQTYKWSELEPCPVIIPADGCMELCNGKIYAGFLRTIYQNSNFYSYNIQNNTWTECADLPYQQNTTARASATIQNKIYVFMSGSNKKAIYDPLNDTWSLSFCNVPDFINSTRMFVYNDEYYFYRGSAENTLYKYDLSTDSFLPIVIEGLNYGNSTFFSLNGKFYCILGCKVFEFNMLDKNVIEKPEFSILAGYNNTYAEDSFLFEFNNNAYFIFAHDMMLSFSTDN